MQNIPRHIKDGIWQNTAQQQVKSYPGPKRQKVQVAYFIPHGLEVQRGCLWGTACAFGGRGGLLFRPLGACFTDTPTCENL